MDKQIPKHFLADDAVSLEEMRSAEDSPHTQLEIDDNQNSPSLKLPDMHSQVDSNGADCYGDYNEEPVEPVTITPDFSLLEENKNAT